MDKCSKVAAIFISSLRAIAIIHQNNHWLTKGESFYGDHLLFENLYNSTLGDLDIASEKFIGVFGPDCLDFELSTSLLNKILLKYKGMDCVASSLAAEKDFLKFADDAYKCFKNEGRLTLGLDDMIMSIASAREKSIYLLKQKGT